MKSLSKTFSINVNEVDCNDEYVLTALLLHFQETVDLHTKQMGMDIRYLQEAYGVTWIVTKIRVDFVGELPHGGDEVVVETYPLEPGLVRLERECSFSRGGDVFVRLSSEWCILSLTSGLPVRPTSAGYPEMEHRTERLASEYATLPTAFDESDFIFEHVVRLTDIDINNHMNNVRYSSLALDVFTREEWGAFDLKSYQINYLAQAREGEALRVYKHKTDDAVFIKGVLPNGKNAFVAGFFTNNA